MIILKNERLLVEIGEPGALYKSMRFDWTGLIHQITLDGKHTFCTRESLDPFFFTEKGIGLCHEFGISIPVGYDECPVGEVFLKIGTGKIFKDSSDPYDFFKKYKFVPVSTNVEITSESKISISSSDQDGRGYGYQLEKLYSLSENRLSIVCTLKNTGSKHIVTDEYCHNFMALDQKPIDNCYRLEFDTQLDPATFENTVNPANCTLISTESMSWQSIPESDFFFSKLGKMKSWKISHDTTGTYVSEKVNFQPSYCNLWGKEHVISPELFFPIELEPGKQLSWERKYEFGYLK